LGERLLFSVAKGQKALKMSRQLLDAPVEDSLSMIDLLFHAGTRLRQLLGHVGRQEVDGVGDLAVFLDQMVCDAQGPGQEWAGSVVSVVSTPQDESLLLHQVVCLLPGKAAGKGVGPKLRLCGDEEPHEFFVQVVRSHISKMYSRKHGKLHRNPEEIRGVLWKETLRIPVVGTFLRGRG
jgi:hypothetical protein